jgi:hypothetical protein
MAMGRMYQRVIFDFPVTVANGETVEIYECIVPRNGNGSRSDFVAIKRGEQLFIVPCKVEYLPDADGEE